jgi:D-aspartate ligase
MSSPERPGLRAADRGKAPAVVIGLDSITGLQTARILDARGVPVVGVVADRRHWGARTRVCVELVEAPLQGEGLVTALLELGRRRGTVSVLLPCTDGSVATVSRHRAELEEHFVLPLAEHRVVEMLMDKVSFAAYGAEAGLPVPRTEVLTSRTQVEELADTLSYPCVVKPPGKAPSWLAHTSAKAFTVHDRDELLSVYDTVAGWAPVLLVQEWVAGPETGLLSCNAYFAEGGTPLVTFVARKIRQWPPEVGTSASGEECRDEDVVKATLRLFGDLGFRGLAYLEMKRDIETGELMIIEPNVGRPTGRSAIAEAGGVELVYTAYCDALGLPLPDNREQRFVGAKWLDFRRDLQAAVVARRKGTLSARDWVRWVRGPKAHAIWSRDDPGPFLTDVVQASRTGAKMALSSRRHRASPPGHRAHPAPGVRPELESNVVIPSERGGR